MSKYMYIKEIKRKILNSNVYFPQFFTHSHCTQKKKKEKKKEEDSWWHRVIWSYLHANCWPSTFVQTSKNKKTLCIGAGCSSRF